MYQFYLVINYAVYATSETSRDVKWPEKGGVCVPVRARISEDETDEADDPETERHLLLLFYFVVGRVVVMCEEGKRKRTGRQTRVISRSSARKSSWVIRPPRPSSIHRFRFSKGGFVQALYIQQVQWLNVICMCACARMYGLHACPKASVGLCMRVN